MMFHLFVSIGLFLIGCSYGAMYAYVDRVRAGQKTTAPVAAVLALCTLGALVLSLAGAFHR